MAKDSRNCGECFFAQEKLISAIFVSVRPSVVRTSGPVPQSLRVRIRGFGFETPRPPISRWPVEALDQVKNRKHPVGLIRHLDGDGVREVTTTAMIGRPATAGFFFWRRSDPTASSSEKLFWTLLGHQHQFSLILLGYFG
jgi:hypothetical protein